MIAPAVSPDDLPLLAPADFPAGTVIARRYAEHQVALDALAAAREAERGVAQLRQRRAELAAWLETVIDCEPLTFAAAQAELILIDRRIPRMRTGAAEAEAEVSRTSAVLQTFYGKYGHAVKQLTGPYHLDRVDVAEYRAAVETALRIVEDVPPPGPPPAGPAVEDAPIAGRTGRRAA